LQFTQANTRPKIAKELPSFPLRQNLIKNISFPSENKKNATYNRHAMTGGFNNDNGLQTLWTKGLLIIE